MKFSDINKMMNYSTKLYGSGEKNMAVSLMGLISLTKASSIENKEQLLEYIQDEIKYGLPLSTDQQEILLGEINKENELEEVRNFRI